MDEQGRPSIYAMGKCIQLEHIESFSGKNTVVIGDKFHLFATHRINANIKSHNFECSISIENFVYDINESLLSCSESDNFDQIFLCGHISNCLRPIA